MAALPYMPFYVSDYLGDTLDLTNSEHGSYILLLCAMWQGGGKLANDEVRLARTARLSLDKWRKQAPKILSFFVIEDGHLVHRRLRAEYLASIERVSKRRESGKLGGAAKALKSNDQGLANASVLPKQSPGKEREVKLREEEREKEDTPAGRQDSLPRDPGQPASPPAEDVVDETYRRCWEAMGWSDQQALTCHGQRWWVEHWIEQGIPPETIVSQVTQRQAEFREKRRAANDLAKFDGWIRVEHEKRQKAGAALPKPRLVAVDGKIDPHATLKARGFAASPEHWDLLCRRSILDGNWTDDLGPAPGADGSFVPAAHFRDWVGRHEGEIHDRGSSAAARVWKVARDLLRGERWQIPGKEAL